MLTVVSFGGDNVLRLASNLILTRILFPEAFGLMALVQVVLASLSMLSDLGIFSAIVQNKRGDDLNTIGSYSGRERRWVIYDGANDASRVPSEWHGWLHGAFDDVPESHLPPAKIWETDYTPNATGTASAYRPSGALEMGGKRARASGDYEAWSPDQ